MSCLMTKPTKWHVCPVNSDQPRHPPNLIRVFAVCMKKAWVLSYTLSAQRRLWSDWADAQADLSLRWVHSHFVGFVMRWLILLKLNYTYMLNLIISIHHSTGLYHPESGETTSHTKWWSQWTVDIRWVPLYAVQAVWEKEISWVWDI